MKAKRKALTFVCAAVLVATTGGAKAACNANNPTGKWHVFLMEGSPPNIKSTTATVGNTTNNGSVQLKVFQNIPRPFENGTAHAIKCVLTIAANGNFSNAPCTTYRVTGAPNSANVSGNITLSACNISGTINVPGDTAVTIQGGHINGNIGAGIATQGAKSVLSFTMVKD